MPSAAYKPDDARITVAAVEYLHSSEGTALREAVARLGDGQTGDIGVAEVEGLRRRFSVEGIHAALAMGAIQKKGAAKFPGLPYVWATPEALEQATALPVAQHKAERFRELLEKKRGHILDLCAGIGGDTAALADVGDVTAIDLSAVRTCCLQLNLESMKPAFPVEVVTGDLRDYLPRWAAESLFHIDPSRRSEGKRSPRYEDLIPGPEVIEKLMARFRGGAIKLSSAVDFESLPPGHLELIGYEGTVVQAVLWVGAFSRRLAMGERTATIVRKDQKAWTFSATFWAAGDGEAELPVLATGSFFYELDGAVTRAGLARGYAAGKGLTALTPDGGYLWSAERVKDVPLVGFEILEVVPFSEGRVAERLAALSGKGEENAKGAVEVKTRGRLAGVETDRLQRVWSKKCGAGFTVLVFRYRGDVAAVIARRGK